MTIPNDDSTNKKRWIHLRRILERGGPFKDPNFEPSIEVYTNHCIITCNYVLISASISN
jgi:hypothetical protein